jgi:hypothetical protein
MLGVALTATLTLVGLSMKAEHVGAAAQSDLSESAVRQINALIAEKESRSPAQQKIDSQLLYAAKMDRGEQIAEGVRTLDVKVTPDLIRKRSHVDAGPLVDDSKGRNDLALKSDESMVTVDISGRVDATLLSAINATGGEILNSMPAYNSVRASLPIQRLEEVAALDSVSFIGSEPQAMFSGSGATPGAGVPSAMSAPLPSGFAGRAATVKAKLAGLLPNAPQIRPFVGSQNSQGDITHKAATARTVFGVNGTGVKIGVLSNGVVSLAASQALGDLGPVTVLPGQTGTGDEGTAMLEIIHDLAPGAQLFFATSTNNSITQFAQNIRDLRTAGCDIIVDDVFFFVESPFQDGAPGPTNTNGGAVIQAVNDVVASGAMYFSSAGNSGNKNDNTSGVWEGDFVDGGASAAPLPLTGNVHNFGGQNFDVITLNGSQINLYWSDPLGGSSNDYDLFILNAAGTAVLASSTNIQNGTQDPFEVTGSGVNLRIVVLKKTGAAARFLHVNSNRGRLSINTVGQTHGHAGATGAFGCAATPANVAFGAPPNPVGPFPNPFNSTNTVELFSSDGPRHIFYNANGTAITPGNVSSTGGTTLQKPDITAADGVSDTGVGGFPTTFYGTSAAAPHAAAIAGLIKSAGPFTPAQIRTALLSTAIDIEAAGTDRDSGAGIVMAFEALNFLGVAGQANLELGTVTTMENPGDADAVLEPGEGGKVTIQLKNTGVVDATSIVGTLTTATPGVTITQPSVSAYPNLPSLTGAGTNLTPFTFTLAPTFPCGSTITFSLTVTYVGGPSPRVFTIPVSTAPPATVITTTLDATPPAGGTGFTATTGLQTPRITRAAPAGACGVAKAFPGVTGTGTRQFDAYSFTTCASSAPYCVTVTLTNGCTGNKQLFDAVYSGTFDPNNLGTNYLTDAAASNIVGGAITFSVTIPAASTFVVVVADVNTGVDSAVGCSYTLSVSGACLSCQTANQPPIASCQNVTVAAGASCTATASINNGSSDPEGGPLTLTQSPAGPYALGTTSVLLTVTDNKGATSQCTATVTVTDTSPPTITCPANITVSAAAGQCSAVVSYSAPTATDNCSTPTVVSTPASGSTFPKGVTTVTATATDGVGNTATCSFTVTVNDTQPPSITCPANVTAVTPNGASSVIITYPAPVAADNCPGVTVACSPASGSSVPLGTTTVTCTATDTSGNTATCSFTVTAFDVCVQDDGGLSPVVLVNSATGDYRFCCGGTMYTGRGTVTSRAGSITVEQNTGSRRVLIKLDRASRQGTASYASPPGQILCTIRDTNILNNSCNCQ